MNISRNESFLKFENIFINLLKGFVLGHSLIIGIKLFF